MKADIGIIGLAVMGENLVMNIESKGFSVAVYNRTAERVREFIGGRARGKNITGAYSIAELTGALKKPRKVMLMVKAGQAVDGLIEQLLPHLEKGDIIIDGGNSHFSDTARRTAYVESKGLLYIGTGISGGEEGALKGPSIMPGGSFDAWKQVEGIFKAAAAKTDDGAACCEWIGGGGAGHFVKMVHNGIEYGDMQLICEAYYIMKKYLGMTNSEMHKVFKEWNTGILDSYLIEITRDILGYKEDKAETLDTILDAAGQKGTGKWTSVAALDEGVPLTLINEAVYARCLSALKDERVVASRIFNESQVKAFDGDKKAFVDDIMQALYASKIVSYAQGYALMRAAAQSHGWDLDFGKIAMIWRGGCIIRSRFLSDINGAFEKNRSLTNLMTDDFFKNRLLKAQGSWRRVVAAAVTGGIAIPAFCSALSYFDGYRSENLPANLLQAQRDYFGAHTYERVDRPRGEMHHTNWTGKGGNTSASTYNA